MRGRARSQQGERGAAAVEFALVMPLLLVLLLGIISFGFMLSFRQGLSQAAAEAARAAAVAPAGADRQAIVEDVVHDVLGVACGSTYLTCAVATPASCAECVSITLTYRYAADPSKPVFPGTGAVMPEELSYTASSEISE